jgi:hypothetical protein
MKEKAIIFGASTLGEAAYLKLKDSYDITNFCDNDANKWGKLFCNIDIISPHKLKEIKHDKVIIASMYYNQITEQLINMKINNFSIFAPYLFSYEMGIMMYPWGEYYKCEKKVDKEDELIINISLDSNEYSLFCNMLKIHNSKNLFNKNKKFNNNYRGFRALFDEGEFSTNNEIKKKNINIELIKSDCEYLIKNDLEFIFFVITYIYSSKGNSIFNELFLLFSKLKEIEKYEKEKVINLLQNSIDKDNLTFIQKSHYHCFISAIKGKKYIF